MLTTDEYFMQCAVSVAGIVAGQSSPNPPVGAVVVQNGQIVGQGAHLAAGGPHAEVHALNMAGSAAWGSTLYVTLEPCNHQGRTPPCTDAILQAGVRRVVVGSVDPNPHVTGHGLTRLRQAGLAITVGVLKSQTDAANEAFFHFVQKSRPFVIWKCAATLDGYIAAKSGASRYVTSEVARAEVQELRRKTPAIAVGIGTVIADNPKLTIRDDSGVGPTGIQPIRIVFDSKLRIPLTAALLQEPGQTVIITVHDAFQKNAEKIMELHKNAAVSILPIQQHEGRVSLDVALAKIAEQFGLMSILLEGGATLANAFLQRKLVDKIVYYIAPKLLGGGIAALAGQETKHMNEAITLSRITHRIVGNDFCIEGYPIYHD